MIRVQESPFDIAEEMRLVRQGNLAIGATAAFVGTVRELSGDSTIDTMTLEHYPGMTEKALEDIAEQARERWPLEALLVVHRYGRLEPGDDIVLVITASAHRKAAFDACMFLMDWLKTKAPFWKLESGQDRDEWVDSRLDDEAAAARWDTNAS